MQLTTRARRGLALAVLALALFSLLVLAVRARLPPHLILFTDVGVLPISGVAAAAEVPETASGRAVLTHLAEIELSTTSSRYAHATDVEPRTGRYHWDCSGMVGWLLRRHAPRAFVALGRPRPVARDFARTIERSPREGESSGWQRVARIEDVRAGDVFAWRSPPAMAGPNDTGHVGVVLATPRRTISWRRVWAVPIADSTTLPHERDSRAGRGDTDGGLGTGVMTFVEGSDGRITHYGWVGVLSPIYVEAEVAFGRLHG